MVGVKNIDFVLVRALEVLALKALKSDEAVIVLPQQLDPGNIVRSRLANCKKMHIISPEFLPVYRKWVFRGRFFILSQGRLSKLGNDWSPTIDTLYSIAETDEILRMMGLGIEGESGFFNIKNLLWGYLASVCLRSGRVDLAERCYLGMREGMVSGRYGARWSIVVLTWAG